MGRHEMREVWRTTVPRQSHRFLIAIGAILALAFLSMALVAALYPESGPASAQPDPNAPATYVYPSAPDTASPDDPGAAPLAGQVLAEYEVPDGGVWGTGFQAQVTMTNITATPQSWQLRLVYPRSVTGYVSSFIDGYPAPSEQAADQQFILTGSVPIPAGQTIVLKIEFNKATTSDFTPRDCVVNGQACTRQ